MKAQIRTAIWIFLVLTVITGVLYPLVVTGIAEMYLRGEANGSLIVQHGDYVTKPFGVGELLARMRVALRHAARTGEESGGSVFSSGQLRVDLAQRSVWVAEREIHLTPIEYKLLNALVRNAGKVMTHRQLLQDVWGPHHTQDSHYVRIYVRQLRNKLEPNPAHPRYLLTELGVGYRLRSDEDARDPVAQAP